jgi:hypothetical protein
MRSDASDKTAKHNESDDHFRLADNPGVDTIFEHKRVVGTNVAD